MSRFVVQLTRLEDQEAFGEVLGLLTRLYPERPVRAFEEALARLPCVLSHDAEPAAARLLMQALQHRGARVRATPVGQPIAEAGGASSAEIEVDLEAFRRGSAGPSPLDSLPPAPQPLRPLGPQRGARSPGLKSPRSLPDLKSPFSSLSAAAHPRAPWEDS